MGARNLAMTAYALNLFDMLCTLWALHGGAVELNPLMRSVTVMVCYKVVIVGALLGYVGAQEGGVFWTLFAFNAFTVGLGEALVTYILGLPLLRWIEKTPALRQYARPL